jgi:hypothetical protein
MCPKVSHRYLGKLLYAPQAGREIALFSFPSIFMILVYV